MVRRVVWGMLYADDAGVVSTSPRGLTRTMDVIVVACQEFGLAVSEKNVEAIHLWSIPTQRRTRCELRRQGNDINRRPSLCTLVVLSARARTLTPRLSVALAPLGEYQKMQFPVVRPTERPAVAQDQAIQSGGSGRYAVRMCHVDYALSGLSQLTYCPPQATFAHHRLSAQGPHRV